MARANRHHIPGCIWHIIHRCHKKEFLLKFDRAGERGHALVATGDEANFTPENRAIGPNVGLFLEIFP
jgi:REP element-mobilizing transposase RayT